MEYHNDDEYFTESLERRFQRIESFIASKFYWLIIIMLLLFGGIIFHMAILTG